MTVYLSPWREWERSALLVYSWLCFERSAKLAVPLPEQIHDSAQMWEAQIPLLASCAVVEKDVHFHACVCVCVCEEALEVATLSRLVAVRKNLLFSNLRRPFIFKAEGRIGKKFCCCFVWWSLLSVFWCTGEYLNFYFIEPMTCSFPSSFWLQFNCFLFINIPTCEHLIHLKCICEAFISHYNTFPNIGETVGDCWATNIKPSKPTQ